VSRSWRNSWGPELKFRESRGTRHDWKRNINKEEEEVSDTVKVFVIINEWTDIANDTSSEVTGGKWFASEDEAWDALDLIAEAHGVELDQDETSLQLEDHKSGLQNEEYRIEELTRG
jgi:hypothetical protein